MLQVIHFFLNFIEIKLIHSHAVAYSNLDMEIWLKFYQFDLYATYSQKIKLSNFGHFL
jgi:hypothetical protein